MARQESEETLATIRRAGAILFARNGYHATNISELSSEVGIGRAGLYYHIGSKEQLLFDITHRSISVLLHAAEKITASARTPEEQLIELARVLMRNIADHLNEWTVFFREHDALTGGWREQLVAGRDRYESLWSDVLTRATADSGFVRVSRLATKGILGMFNYSYLWLDPEGKNTPEEIADEVCEIILHGLKP